MGFPGPGTFGQMVPGTRDHYTWDQDQWLNFDWDQGPKQKRSKGPGTKAEKVPGTRDHLENMLIFDILIFQ